MDKTENGSPVSLEYAIVIGDTFHRTSPPTRDGFEFWTRFRIVNATETEIASSKRCVYICMYILGVWNFIFHHQIGRGYEKLCTGYRVTCKINPYLTRFVQHLPRLETPRNPPTFSPHFDSPILPSRSYHKR